MNDVIARLVLRALPDAGGVRPGLANRFDREPSPSALAPEASPLRSGDVAPRTAASAHGRSFATFSAPPGDVADDQSEALSLLDPTAAVARSPASPVRAGETRPLVERESEANAPIRVVNDGNVFPAQPRREGASSPPGPQVDEERLIPTMASVLPLSEPSSARPSFAASGLRHGNSEPPQPDIRISIERIDVRTNQVERGPERARPPGLTFMSLEDYLGKARAKR